MMLRNTGCLPALTIGMALVGIGGCIGSPVADLPADEEVAPVDTLNALTAGDLADAFVNFRNGLGSSAGRENTAGITSDQRAAIELLQSQYDAGQITQTEFITSVVEALNNRDPAAPLADLQFLGFPFSGAGHIEAVPGLSEEQSLVAQEIYRTLHSEIADLRSVAQMQIRTLLSAAQRAMLEQITQDLVGQTGLPDAEAARAKLMLDALAQRLGLTVDQQQQVADIRALLRGVVEELHVKAREEILRLLGDSRSS